jgi:hypothetical protein
MLHWPFGEVTVKKIYWGRRFRRNRLGIANEHIRKAREKFLQRADREPVTWVNANRQWVEPLDYQRETSKETFFRDRRVSGVSSIKERQIN